MLRKVASETESLGGLSKIRSGAVGLEKPIKVQTRATDPIWELRGPDQGCTAAPLIHRSSNSLSPLPQHTDPQYHSGWSA